MLQPAVREEIIEIIEDVIEILGEYVNTDNLSDSLEKLKALRAG